MIICKSVEGEIKFNWHSGWVGGWVCGGGHSHAFFHKGVRVQAPSVSFASDISGACISDCTCVLVLQQTHMETS